MAEVRPLTYTQRLASPLATRLCAVVFVDRRALAWGIKQIVGSLNDTDKVTLKLALLKHGIIHPAGYGRSIDALEHFDFRKTVTSKRLVRAAEEFKRTAGRNDLMHISPYIISSTTSGRVEAGNGLKHFESVFDGMVRDQVLRDLRRATETTENWRATVLNQAYAVAEQFSGLPKEEQIYRMQKMADIGGDVQTIIAALFMNIPVERLRETFSQLGEEQAELKTLGESVIRIIERWQHLRDHFEFNFTREEIIANPKIIYKKMTEVIRQTRSPQALLLFLFDKLRSAREAAGSSDGIFNEIIFLYAPLAERLGLIFLADDFRDQFLRLTNPEEHVAIEERMRQRIGMNYASAKIFLSVYTRELYRFLRQKLGLLGQDIKIKFRVKSAFSIWHKVNVRHEYTYDTIKDILGIKIICETEQTLRAIKRALVKGDLVVVNPGGVKEVLSGDAAKGWRGVKLEGKDSQGIPIEIQIMTEEMNEENNQGKAAAWRYNLAKELGLQSAADLEAAFEILEPKEVMSASFVGNYYQLLSYWTVPAEQISLQ